MIEKKDSMDQYTFGKITALQPKNVKIDKGSSGLPLFAAEAEADPAQLELIEETHLGFLFQDLLINFAHLIKWEKQTKQEFLENIKETYDISNPRTQLFYQSCERSKFNTIRLNRTKDAVLFNEEKMQHTAS